MKEKERILNVTSCSRTEELYILAIVCEEAWVVKMRETQVRASVRVVALFSTKSQIVFVLLKEFGDANVA